jgi:hypothetical protein
MTNHLTIPMDDTRTGPRRLGRSITAVVVALVVNAVLSLGVDQIMHSLGIYPPWGQPMPDSLFLLATAYRVVFGVLSGYIAARLAPNRPMAHALALGVVGVILSFAGLVATWNAGPAFGAKWYPIALVVLAMPCAWAGGKLYAWQRTR